MYQETLSTKAKIDGKNHPVLCISIMTSDLISKESMGVNIFIAVDEGEEILALQAKDVDIVTALPWTWRM